MNLFFRKYGEGRPVIILHGLFGISDNWVTLGKRLAEKKYSVYIPDQRNHGNSPHDDHFNYDLLSSDLNEFIAQHQLADPVIIGHSMGGKVAMNYALNFNSTMEYLVIADMGIKKYPSLPNEIFDILLAMDPGDFETRADIEKYLSSRIHNKRTVQLLIKNFHLSYDSGFEWKINLKSIRENYEGILDGIHATSSYNGKTLFIRGELSDYITDEDIPEIKKVFPRAEFKTIKGASHWIHADKPAEFLETVLQFIQ
jgi:esterase